MSQQDEHFMSAFKAVMIFMVVLFVIVFILAQWVSSSYKNADSATDAEVAEQIAPVAKLRVEGDAPVSAPASPAQAAAPAAEPVAAGPVDGQAIYTSACFACHGTGAAGAPVVGDKAAWANRIAKGADTLLQNAVNGFQGATGFMPPKGGRADLSDDAMRAAVEHMVAQSQ